jgi:hypothetical protein
MAPPGMGAYPPMGTPSPPYPPLYTVKMSDYGIEEYTVSDDTITMDYNFGNILVSRMVFSCEGNIVTFVDQNNLNYVRLGTNLDDCNSASLTEQTQNSSLMNGKYYDLLGKEIEDITTYPMNSLYIKNGRKYIKE